MTLYGWSSKICLIINYNCRNVYSVDYTGIYIVKYYANDNIIGTATTEKIINKLPTKCEIVNNKIVLTYYSEKRFDGDNKIIYIGS